MKDYIVKHPWKIIEEGFNAENNRISESLFSIGNGEMGQRGNFEESYSGDSLKGNYVGGIYYPDKTRVGWWKNGYPDYFAKVLNATSWFDLDISFGKEQLDLGKAEILSFTRELDFRDGVLIRDVEVNLEKVKNIKISSAKFISKADTELAVLHYRISAEKYKGKLRIKSTINGDVHNEDANYDEQFWEPISEYSKNRDTMVVNRTKKTGFIVGTAARTMIFINGKEWKGKVKNKVGHMQASFSGELKLKKGDVVDIFKYASIVSSRYHKRKKIGKKALKNIEIAAGIGWNQHLTNQRAAWLDVWEHGDIEIKGDMATQQGIRFCIFQMYQTYDGSDSRLNIGPKGFTGEKYGGSTYWDTEAYCLPFYMFTASSEVARNLLLYRYDQLDKAIENAEKLGFHSGAALYPMVTMNGEECHNEWEITFEEIHRNGAIAYAIYDYVNTTGDVDYIDAYGIEVLVGIARFWAQRVNWSEEKQKFVMLGVTGPNEYENNVNNNWYTNYIASWCLRYAAENAERIEKGNQDLFVLIKETVELTDKEIEDWKHIAGIIYLPDHHDLGIFLQQDGFMDKEIKPASELSEKDVPINQNWSWDRILRSCYIKQADVLQGLYFFEEDFDLETIRRNYNFYEPITVHESSLSPCVHAILASRLGNIEEAYKKMVRTARLDLDDINNDTEDGCHITSMAGTWMALVKGLGGMKIVDGKLVLSPALPELWDGYNFSLGGDHIIHTKGQGKGYPLKLRERRLFPKNYDIK